MKLWILPDGKYYAGFAPVTAGSVAVAPRPTVYHAYTGTPSLDPAICWRPMTQAEIDAIKAALASSVANGVELQDVVKAAFLVVLDGINTLRAQHSLAAVTPAQFKQAIINKLPNP